MMPTLSEIILLIVIILLVTGLAKAGDIGEMFGRMRAKFLEGMKEGEEDDNTIDITPDREDGAQSGGQPSHSSRE